MDSGEKSSYLPIRIIWPIFTKCCMNVIHVEAYIVFECVNSVNLFQGSNNRVFLYRGATAVPSTQVLSL